MQMAQEDRFYEFGHLMKSTKPLVILCDKYFLNSRGVLDSFAWVDDMLWEALLEELGLNTF
jgi:hypothetical protein